MGDVHGQKPISIILSKKVKEWTYLMVEMMMKVSEDLCVSHFSHFMCIQDFVVHQWNHTETTAYKVQTHKHFYII